MKRLEPNWHKQTGPVTIWSKGSPELIPERLRRVVIFVMPLTYLLLFMFGVSAAYLQLPAFENLVGTFYGAVWGTAVAITSAISLLTLIFRLKLEIYSSIALSTLLIIYPLYIAYLVFHDASRLDLGKFGVIFSAAILVVLPVWRVIDIVLEVRKSRQRQLFAECSLGEANTNDTATRIIRAD